MDTLQQAMQITEERVDGSIFIEATRAISKGEISAIRKFTRSDIDEAAVYTFPCLAIDTNPTRNGVVYSAESQKSTCKKWIGIPFLFNANAQGAGIFSNGQDHTVQAASQFGRIYKAQVVETGNGHIGTLVWVYTFPDISPAVREFCNKIDTGILREVSIHVMAKNGVVCSICHESFGADNHEHVPGQKYGKETCYVETVGQLEPIELSSVACPGSVQAHIMDDSEVSKYKLLSLREALRGSHSEIEALMETEIKDEKPLAESAPDPSLTEGDKPADNDESKKDDEAEEKGDKPKDAAKKQSLGLFEGSGECPVCNRTESNSDGITDEQRESVIAEFREETEAKVLKIVEAANEKVSLAESRATTAEAATVDADAMLGYFAEQTVDLAIEKGLKKPEHREATLEEYRALGFRGIKALREAYSESPSKRDDAKKSLQEMAASQFKARGVGATATTPKGRVGGFSAPVGPSKRG